MYYNVNGGLVIVDGMQNVFWKFKIHIFAMGCVYIVVDGLQNVLDIQMQWDIHVRMYAATLRCPNMQMMSTSSANICHVCVR